MRRSVSATLPASAAPALLPPLPAIPPDVACVTDYEPLARPRMTAAAWAYFSGGAGEESSLAANRAAFAQHCIVPRLLQDMRHASTALTLLGQPLAHPILLAPVAYQRLAHPQGEAASAQAAVALGGGCVVSTQASMTLETVAEAARAIDPAGGKLWFQLYLQRQRADTLALVRRAEQAGYAALVLTVDAPVNGWRDRERRAGFTLPPGVSAVNLAGQMPAQDAAPSLADSPLFGTALLQHAPTWPDVQWLRGQTRLPLWIKGILTAPDARQALSCGADGLIVSNHGGRVLDGLPPTLVMLPEVLQVTREHAQQHGGAPAPVLMDGGIRRGTDVFKALCLGAQAVLIGRPYVYALAAAGAPGVAHALHLLRGELELAMSVAGCATLADVQPDNLRPAMPKPP